MTTKTVTRSQYYQLLGLKTLALKHNKALEEIIAAINEVLGSDDDGHVMDAVYSDYISVDNLLDKLEIKVED